MEQTQVTEVPKVETTETPKVDVTPAPAEKKDDLTSARFAALARKEKMARRLYMEAEAKEKIAKDLETKFTTAKANPLEALKMLGLTYDDLTAVMMNSNKPTPELEIKAVREEFAQLKKEQEEKERAAKEAQTKAQVEEIESSLKAYDEYALKFIEDNKDTYEFTHAYQASHLIRAHQEEHYQRTGYALPMADIAKEVEDYLEQEHLKASQLKKFQSKFSKIEEKKEAEKQETRTLSNSMTSSAASLLPAKNEQDRLTRALAKLT